MITSFDIDSLRRTVREWKAGGQTLALVPTMGNLHAGHLSLLARAREMADRTVVSIFVNPIQFGHGEDYENYPSTLDEDLTKLERAGLDLVFAPNLEELYPRGTDEDTRVTVPAISDILCGKFRPGHFSGVATVVTKLLNNVQPDYALFGEKDYQQLVVIKRLVHDLLIPVEIVGMPIVREPDGLAMSSRNSYLTREQRRRAGAIYRSLCAAAERLKAGVPIPEIEREQTEALGEHGMRPEYFSIRNRVDLAPARAGDRELIILTAVWLGDARLIDNLKLDLPEPLGDAAIG